MELPATRKFLLENLDCTNCAAKIERGLCKVEGVRNPSIDFANLTLYVDTPDDQRILDAIQRIDPGVRVSPHRPGLKGSEDKQQDSQRTAIISLGAASLLFIFLLVGEEWLHQISLRPLELLIVGVAYLLSGWNVLLGAWRTIRNRTFFDENVLMVIATVGALAIHAYAEAIGVMIFYKIGELLQDRVVNRSRRSIRSLLAVRPDRAVVQTDQGLKEVSPDTVSVGDIILVKPGEKVPLDGEVVSGKSQVDTSPLTGEFKPRTVVPGDQVMAGHVNQSGLVTIRVLRPFTQSSIAKVMDLVENASARKARTERFITAFARYYTPAVVFTATAIAVLPPLLLGYAFETWLYRALVLLVISCPCALVISIPLGYFGGIGAASRKGIFVKGANYFDVLAGLRTVVFDKTGTLTQGVFKVNQTVSLNGFSPDQLLAFAAAAEYYSTHPIARSIVAAAEALGHVPETDQIRSHKEISGQGVKAEYKQRTILVGNDQMLHRYGIMHDRCEFDATVAHVVVDDAYVGYILIGDELKNDAKAAVDRLRQEGVDRVVMFTGDNACTAGAVASQLGLDRVHSNLLPEQKVALFEQLVEERSGAAKIAFVGDGINDAPVLARADVGIAMGGMGADAAIEIADVVLMNDSPVKVAEAVAIAKRTRRIVWQNIVLAFAIKAVFIVSGAFGLATMWEAVFADMGTALLAVANASRALGRDPLGMNKKRSGANGRAPAQA